MINLMEILKDIEYGNGQKLDLYLPDNKSFTTIVYIHGGGMVGCDKGDPNCVDVVTHLVNLGYGVFNLNYSLYPNAKFPSFINDCALGIKFAFANLNKYGGNGKIYVSGQSAGAYIAMMLCLNNNFLKDAGVNPLSISGWISDSGQMSDHFNVQHFEKGLDPWVQRITELAPLYYVTPDTKANRMLLIYYSNDMLNRKEQNIMLYNAIKNYDKDFDITQVELKGQHCDGSCKKDNDGEYPFVKVIDQWIREKQL